MINKSEKQKTLIEKLKRKHKIIKNEYLEQKKGYEFEINILNILVEYLRNFDHLGLEFLIYLELLGLE